jgi:hypothetical protein
LAAARPMPLVPPVMRAVTASVAICGFSLLLDFFDVEAGQDEPLKSTPF